MNKLCLIGFLGQDPETKNLPSGDIVVNTSIATTEKWKDKQGNKQEKTTWFRLAFFGKLGEIAAQYLRKGSQIYVEGTVSARAWISEKHVEPQASMEVRVRELQMLSSKQQEERPQQQAAPAQKLIHDDEFDSEIPF